MVNHSFHKALALLSHPFSLAALGLMLVNDQVLRRLSPSWWTGKLSDLAWLLYVPFIAAAVLAWLIPGKNRSRHEAWTFSLAFLLTGIVFILLKAVPFTNWMATRIFSAVTGASPSLLLDPGDLLALPALLLSAWLWRSSRDAFGPNSTAHVEYKPAITPRGMLVIPLAALVLMADAAAPDPGITCFSRENGKIFARGGYNSSYISQDGGITWEPYQPSATIECEQAPNKASEEDEWLEVPGALPGTVYRYWPNEDIQLSTDGGKTWNTGMKFSRISEPERIYYLKSRAGSPSINPGPFDAVADQASGNMLFAMGQQGVLVHTAQGQWLWSKGGAYQRPDYFPSPDALALLLGGTAFLALGAALLIYSTLALRWTRHWLRITILTLAWLAWLGVVLIFPPATSYSYSDAISSMGILALAVLIVPLVIEQTVRLVRRAPRDLPRLIGLGLAGGLLFLLPYIFWIYNILPEFVWATVISLIIAAAILVVGWILQRTLRVNIAGEVE
jgi:hypothetical protein